MTANQNRQIVMKQRPEGTPSESDFDIVTAPMPDPGDGEVLVRGLYLSLDPYMRRRMVDVPSYAPPIGIGEMMVGGVVSEVVRSNAPELAPGDIVEGMLGWQEYAAAKPKALRKVDPTIAPISTALGVLGMPGMTAYFGMMDICRPKSGETLVVSAASGAVGAVVGQIGKIHGCRVVGIAGADAKLDYVTRELGFDAGINYKTAGDLDAALAAACSDGVDVYFDNVGGVINDAVMRHINLNARIAICGQIALYNEKPPVLGPRNLWLVLAKRARVQGFLVFDYAKRYPEAATRLAAWIAAGQLKYREDILDGIEAAPRAFIRMLRGENFGKQLVKLAEEAS